jgi:hypothetical protein
MFLKITYRRSFSPISRYMLCPSHSPRLDHSICTQRRVQATALLIMQFYLPFCHFIPFHSSILHNPYLSINFKNQFLHPYRAVVKITILYIIIVRFLDRRLQILSSKYLLSSQRCILCIQRLHAFFGAVQSFRQTQDPRLHTSKCSWQHCAWVCSEYAVTIMTDECKRWDSKSLAIFASHTGSPMLKYKVMEMYKYHVSSFVTSFEAAVSI